jgi:hypothetical protein
VCSLPWEQAIPFSVFNEIPYYSDEGEGGQGLAQWGGGGQGLAQSGLGNTESVGPPLDLRSGQMAARQSFGPCLMSWMMLDDAREGHWKCQSVNCLLWLNPLASTVFWQIYGGGTAVFMGV